MLTILTSFVTDNHPLPKKEILKFGTSGRNEFYATQDSNNIVDLNREFMMLFVTVHSIGDAISKFSDPNVF